MSIKKVQAAVTDAYQHRLALEIFFSCAKFFDIRPYCDHRRFSDVKACSIHHVTKCNRITKILEENWFQLMLHKPSQTRKISLKPFSTFRLLRAYKISSEFTFACLPTHKSVSRRKRGKREMNEEKSRKKSWRMVRVKYCFLKTLSIDVNSFQEHE